MTHRESIHLSGKSIGLLTEISRAAYEQVLELAVERAARSDRKLVSEEDVRACVKEALEHVAEQPSFSAADHQVQARGHAAGCGR